MHHLHVTRRIQRSISLLLATALGAAGHGTLHLLIWLLWNGDVVLAEGRLDLSNEHISLFLHYMVVAEMTDTIKKEGVLLRFNLVKDGKVLR